MKDNMSLIEIIIFFIIVVILMGVILSELGIFHKILWKVESKMKANYIYNLIKIKEEMR